MNSFRDSLLHSNIQRMLACLVVALVFEASIAAAQIQKSEGDCSPNIVAGQDVNLFLVCYQDGTIRPRGPGDADMITALDFINRGNMKLAAEFSEKALRIWSALPNKNEPYIKNKMAAAHSVIGLGLATMGLTERDRSIGCHRLLLARNLYVQTRNAARIAMTDDDMRLGGCRAAR